MKKINFSQVEIFDIKNEKIELEQKIHEVIGNTIFMVTNDIALAELAKRIHAGEEVELRDNEVQDIKNIILGDHFPFLPVVKRQIIAFIG